MSVRQERFGAFRAGLPLSVLWDFLLLFFFGGLHMARDHLATVATALGATGLAGLAFSDAGRPFWVMLAATHLPALPVLVIEVASPLVESTSPGLGFCPNWTGVNTSEEPLAVVVSVAVRPAFVIGIAVNATLSSSPGNAPGSTVRSYVPVAGSKVAYAVWPSAGLAVSSPPVYTVPVFSSLA